jgi:predicted phage-related endonuclease
MKTHSELQGSDSWLALRASMDGSASEAPAAMGASKYMTRDELLKIKVTGIAPEVTADKQRLFNRGHETEAAIRPYVEELLGEELYPVTGSIEIEGLKLLASFDGLTMMEDKGFEHKLWSESLAESVRNGQLDPHYYWQLEQQLLVSGAEFILFVVSDGTKEKCEHMAYWPVPGRREALIAGWKQFKIDLENYVVTEPEAAKPAGEVIKDLPALHVEIAGEVKASNLAIYKNHALDFIRNINTDLQTDEDFATAENVVKFCDRVEKELEIVKKNTLGQVLSIDEVVRTIDQLKEEMRQKRLQLEKLVKAEKESRKTEILLAAKDAWQKHVELCNSNLGSVRLPEIAVNFAEAMKNKRTIESLRSAANDELARAKIEANRWASHIEVNLELLRAIASNHTFLFADRQQLVLKDKDAVEAIAKQRIADHDRQEAERIQAAAQKLADDKIAKEKLEPVVEKAKEPTPQAVIVEQAVIPTTAVSPIKQPVTIEQCPTHEIPLSDYQRGFLAGLELAVKIAFRSSNPSKAIQDFIDGGPSLIPNEAA